MCNLNIHVSASTCKRKSLNNLQEAGVPKGPREIPVAECYCTVLCMPADPCSTLGTFCLKSNKHTIGQQESRKTFTRDPGDCNKQVQSRHMDWTTGSKNEIYGQSMKVHTQINLLAVKVLLLLFCIYFYLLLVIHVIETRSVLQV